MLRLRLITGPLLIIGLVALMWLDARADAWIAHALPADAIAPRGMLMIAFGALVLVPLAALELAALLRGAGVRAPSGLMIVAAELGLIAGSLALGVALAAPAATAAPVMLVAGALPIALLAVVVLALVALSWGQRTDGIGAGVGASLLALAALGVPVAFFVVLRQAHGPWLIVAVILTAKSCDIGAYFTGRAIGRRKLIPWLSPGKTWEGLAGGVCTAAIVGAALAWWSGAGSDPIPIAAGALGGVGLGIAGQAGDLAESLLKRGANAKDSGSTLPGMGGLLDVIDSLLPAGAVAVVVLLAFGVPGT